MMFPKITTDEVFIKMIEIILSNAREDEGSHWGEFNAGADCGYIAALEDLLIVLSNGDRNEMNRPEYYRGFDHG